MFQLGFNINVSVHLSFKLKSVLEIVLKERTQVVLCPLPNVVSVALTNYYSVGLYPISSLCINIYILAKRSLTCLHQDWTHQPSVPNGCALDRLGKLTGDGTMS